MLALQVIMGFVSLTLNAERTKTNSSVPSNKRRPKIYTKFHLYKYVYYVQ